MNDLDLKATSQFAAELANENFQLRQTVIRLRLELEEAKAEGAKADENVS